MIYVWFYDAGTLAVTDYLRTAADQPLRQNAKAGQVRVITRAMPLPDGHEPGWYRWDPGQNRPVLRPRRDYDGRTADKEDLLAAINQTLMGPDAKAILARIVGML